MVNSQTRSPRSFQAGHGCRGPRRSGEQSRGEALGLAIPVVLPSNTPVSAKLATEDSGLTTMAKKKPRALSRRGEFCPTIGFGKVPQDGRMFKKKTPAFAGRGTEDNTVEVHRACHGNAACVRSEASAEADDAPRPKADGAAVCGRKGDRGRRIHDREPNRRRHQGAASGTWSPLHFHSPGASRQAPSMGRPSDGATQRRVCALPHSRMRPAPSPRARPGRRT